MSNEATPRKALIVDDSELTRLIMKLMLEELGFQVELAANAEAAILAVRRDRFDVITMDYHMPTVNGLECLRLIKKQTSFANSHSAIFAATSEEDAGTRQRFLDAGVDDFIEKPLSIEGLRRKILAKAA